ncbi:O-antigen ligase family protein [Pseudaminobacter sp. NGMCC 1.201702]|uniref:O-antigen ligase family protein n=1 Tax=Pseudaminobacter sp. NGMCC 1.201702 TaxID=3391825 RepID=UPI0039F010D3
MKLFDGAPTIGKIGDYVVLCLFMLLVSAVWVESDVYRYAAMILVVWGLADYWKAEFKPSIGWMGLACIVWTAFVAIRYIVVYLDPSVQNHGTSEGIYLFPILYMTVGYMMFRYRHMVGKAAVLFIIISFVMAAATVQPSSLFDDGYHDFLMMNNTIHSSVGAGFIILAGINFASFALKNVQNTKRRFCFEAIAYATVGLCIVGLYGAKSKGVWLAITAALCAQVLLSVRRMYGKRGWIVAGALLATLAAFVAIFSAGIWATMGPTIDSAIAIALAARESGSLTGSIQSAIASGTVPTSMNERLMLWSNAVEVWSHNVVFGSGIAWKDLWINATYNYVGYDLIHNGYLEIGVRYGFTGIIFIGLIYAWSIVQCYRNLTSRESFHFQVVSLIFFLVSIVTNSNNRLAIGESYMLLAAAVGFFSNYLGQHQKFAEKI